MSHSDPMRATLLALCLLATPLAGCIGFGEAATTVEEPSLPGGLVLTYEVTEDGATDTQSVITLPRPDGGTELAPYNVTPRGFSSPFLSLDEDLSPRGFAWEEIFQFPLAPGDSYTATAFAEEATVHVEEATVEYDGEEHDALHVVATTEDDATAELTLLTEPTVLAQVHLEPQDAPAETWHLMEARHDPGWRDKPDWRIGDWWNYNATTASRSDSVTMIYNENATNQQGSPVRVLNQAVAEHRPVALPFQVFLERNLAPQAGILNGMISTFWGDWPMEDGATWTGNSNLAEAYTAHLERSQTTLPNGHTTTAYTMEATPMDEPQAEPFAGWTYAPLVGLFTEAWIHAPDEADPRLDWELTDWGSGYHGEIEIPRLPVLHEREHFDEVPLEEQDEFDVIDQAERLRVHGWFVQGSEDPAPLRLSLEDPEGETRWSMNESRFQDQALNLDDVVDEAQPGPWTLHLDVPPEVSFFLDIQGVWSETRQVDYR